MPLQTSLPVPPPLLLHMQRYGPPPSYPNLKIPGLNAPIPTVHMLLCPGVEEEYSSLFFHYLSLFVCLSLPLSLSLSLSALLSCNPRFFAQGASFGYHPGGWGKPPVDELGRPLYGDVFGTAITQASIEV